MQPKLLPRKSWGIFLVIPVFAILTMTNGAPQHGAVISEAMRMRLETSYPELRENENWLDSSQLDDPGEFIEELIRFFEMGDAEIDLREDETDIVLIVGASGVGKSTLGYVIAGNEENKLSVICDELTGQCRIVDEFGHIGNETIVSQTLLPTFILEENLTPHTAFYDCPGFFDNRNVTVEIANSYFMNKVGYHAKRLKILIIALFEHFKDSSRSDLLNLFSQIVVLFPNIDQYPESVVLVANQMIDLRLTDTQIYNTMKNFLVDKVKAAIESGAVNFPVEGVKKATLLIDTLVGSSAEDSNMYYFPVPDFVQNGSIEEFPRMVAAQQHIRNRIWNETRYRVNTTEADFGYPLSGDAIAELLIAAVGLNSQVQQKLNKIIESTAELMAVNYNKILTGDTTDFPDFVQTSGNIIQAEYPTYSQVLNFEKFASQILEVTSSYAHRNDDRDLAELESSVKYLTRINKIRDFSNLMNPDEWVAQFPGIKRDTNSMVANVAISLDANIQSIAVEAATEIGEFISSLVDKINMTNPVGIADLQKTISPLFAASYPKIRDSEINGNFSKFSNELLKQIRSFSNGQMETLLLEIGEKGELLQELQIVKAILQNTNTEKWVLPFSSILQKIGTKISDVLWTPTLDLTYLSLNQVASSLFRNIKTQISGGETIQAMTTSAQLIKTHLEEIENEIIRVLYHPDTNSFLLFVNAYVGVFKQINPALSNEDLNNLTRLFDIITLVEESLQLDYKTSHPWHRPIVDLISVINDELNFLEFLELLYQGLSTSAIHINKKGDMFAWRQIHSNKPTTVTNLEGLFKQLEDAEVIVGSQEKKVKVKRHITAYPEGFDMLNTVLNYTIGTPLTPELCPRTLDGALRFDFTNYLRMSYVVDCLDRIYPLPLDIVLLSQGKFFLDSSLEIAKHTNSSVNIFLMSTENKLENVLLNLSGGDAPPPSPLKLPGKGGLGGTVGYPGQSGSNFISVYGHQTGNLDVVACGGPGGQGQGGSDGADGAGGIGKTFSSNDDIIPESECAAWAASNGNIQVRIFPNTCNGQGGINDRCHAGNDGIPVVLYGGVGKPGSPGGAGGQGGAGGLGGFLYQMEVTSTSNPIITKANDGSNGNPGAQGSKGNNGPGGRDNRYRIDVVTYGSAKRCKILQRETEFFRVHEESVSTEVSVSLYPNSTDFSPVNQSPRAISCTSTIASFGLNHFKNYIKDFVSSASLSLNPFNYERLNKFITDVQGNPNLN